VIAGIVASIAVVAPVSASVATRFAVAALGFFPVHLSRLDLREPVGQPSAPIGVLTLGTLRRLGCALAELGADPDTLTDTWHGPWRWAGAATTGVWISECRTRVARRSSEVSDTAASFLILHENDHSDAPASTPMFAGRFRVYPFVNRFRII